MKVCNPLFFLTSLTRVVSSTEVTMSNFHFPNNLARLRSVIDPVRKVACHLATDFPQLFRPVEAAINSPFFLRFDWGSLFFPSMFGSRLSQTSSSKLSWLTTRRGARKSDRPVGLFYGVVLICTLCSNWKPATWSDPISHSDFSRGQTLPIFTLAISTLSWIEIKIDSHTCHFRSEWKIVTKLGVFILRIISIQLCWTRPSIDQKTKTVCTTISRDTCANRTEQLVYIDP